MSKPKKYRVVRYNSRINFASTQELQEKHWWGWKTIDREDVPTHVCISMAVYGDTGGWESKFKEYIK